MRPISRWLNLARQISTQATSPTVDETEAENGPVKSAVVRAASGRTTERSNVSDFANRYHPSSPFAPRKDLFIFESFSGAKGDYGRRPKHELERSREPREIWQSRPNLPSHHGIRHALGFSIRISPRSSVAPGLTVKSLRICAPLSWSLTVEKSRMRYSAPGIRAGSVMRPSASVRGMSG
jgi:hypothetical protein